MPAELKYPGVYIEEVSAGPRTIAGVDTSIAAFAGWAKRGPTDRAELVRSWQDFEFKFGGLDKRSLLGYSLAHFFNNGGSRAYVVRLRASGSRSAKAKVLQPNEPDFEAALLPPGGEGGLYHLDNVDLFNLLCVPGQSAPAAIKSLQKFCRDRRAFLIADCGRSATFSDLKSGPGAITVDDSINAAFYFPWVLSPDPLDGNSVREFPPCGFVAGLYARTDVNRGVWKSPAGTDASLYGVTGLSPNGTLNDDQNGTLNRQGINCIRKFPGSGIVVWGARTLRGGDAFGSDWKYVAVRRTALFIENSIYRGLEWVVFEPNGEPLWVKIKQSIENFLLTLFLQGTLQGSKSEEAFFVKVDRSTMTRNDIDSGVVNILIGFAPAKPAEFVIIRLRQMAAQATV
ncbi:MAG TPA: phage tail sheath subtilisin-like domain-containing protein [Pyrinomonadaceae bacterium]|nr:phage tail sheath subtilisin-like domain-containing protein [Pyrinomonadaceae bacterium]